MNCEFCKKEKATIHLTQVVNGEMKKLNLCQGCAKSHGIDLNSPISITDILMGMEKKNSRNKILNNELEYDLTCSRCNMSRAEFSKKARLGCPNCYLTFSAELKTITQAMHHSMNHIGKIPNQQISQIKISQQINSLKKQIKTAIKKEDYEEAAEIRDKIKNLDKSFNEELNDN
tara:strand:+ start:172 stop:693 length:522 start_codon:yes stop_codon:yes gene_type:complete